MSEDKVFFSAVIERTAGMLNTNPKIENSGYYFKDVRTRGGEIIKRYLIPKLDQESQEKLVSYGTGDYVAFLADVELKNIEIVQGR